jgi:hypothetical protein
VLLGVAILELDKIEQSFMKTESRILIYCVLILGYCISTVFYFKISTILPFKEIFWNALIIFSGMNIIVSFLYLKINPFVNILIAILIAYLSLLAAFKFSEFNIFSSDAYGINTTIISNIIFSIILWEIAYRGKQKNGS